MHLELFPSVDQLRSLLDPELLGRWSRLTALREQVLAEIEPLRKDKRIGSSLQAKAVLSVPRDDLAFFQRHAKDLPMLFIVSEVELGPASADSQPDNQGITVTIERTDGVKCERCWRYVKAVSTDPAWAGICDRCQDALAQTTNA